MRPCLIVTLYEKHRCGYDGCGFLGWSKCTRWCTESWNVVEYSIETYLVYSAKVCQDDQITCCNGHIYVLGHCFDYQEILTNQDILAQLHTLGIVIPGVIG
ncbi:unnamed protein product [Didymodactylos carnosus]|uniref:Uncharacterized protein n=1 Tax=Didymodactylos carnosus TaxID=1234261 RepID=A0A8S2DB23_9BILA|nr:unnamed protein product [Didymodactylos carnosus]CAF3636569.1 unnamed protein product [Didymodactylos carnosus]